MIIANIDSYLSQARFQRYRDLCNNNDKKAIQLYKANIRLSQSFYPLLTILEISLRNSIDNFYSNYFSDPNWMRNQKNYFMSDPLLWGNDYMKRKVTEAENKHGTNITHGRIIAEQTFGVWVCFFQKSYYKTLSGSSIRVFQNLPPEIKRRNIYKRLDSIRMFRNRIYHYEPICFKEHNNINYFNLEKTILNYTYILEVMNWISEELVQMVSDLDDVQYELLRTEILAKKLSFLQKRIKKLNLKYIQVKSIFNH